MSLVGKKAPEFSASAVVNGGEFVENFSLNQYLGEKDVIFFFYPLDFTFVCPTELIAFQEKLAEFEKRGVAVVGCSVDSVFLQFRSACCGYRRPVPRRLSCAVESLALSCRPDHGYCRV